MSVALVEILVGVVAGNFLGIHQTTEWINFLAMLGSGVLTSRVFNGREGVPSAQVEG